MIVTFPLSKRSAIFYLINLTIRNQFGMKLFSISSLFALMGIQRYREENVLSFRNCVYMQKKQTISLTENIDQNNKLLNIYNNGCAADTPDRMKGDEGLNESDLYKSLGSLTNNRDAWKESIPFVSSLLGHGSEKIKGKALWLLGEIGMVYPQSVRDTVSEIASYLDSPVPFLRERAVNALGRIGRGCYDVIEPCWTALFRLASDGDPKVRLSFIWASENIAVNTPDIYEDHMPVFEKLLHDADDRVRMEAPEIFRVLGKRRPEFVMPFVEQLKKLSEKDENRIVRIHCLGAVRAAEGGLLDHNPSVFSDKTFEAETCEDEGK